MSLMVHRYPMNVASRTKPSATVGWSQRHYARQHPFRVCCSDAPLARENVFVASRCVRVTASAAVLSLACAQEQHHTLHPAVRQYLRGMVFDSVQATDEINNHHIGSVSTVRCIIVTFVRALDSLTLSPMPCLWAMNACFQRLSALSLDFLGLVCLSRACFIHVSGWRCYCCIAVDSTYRVCMGNGWVHNCSTQTSPQDWMRIIHIHARPQFCDAGTTSL